MPKKIVKRRTRRECSEDDLSRELFFVWRSIMASLQDVNDSITAQTAAIQALTAALAAKPPAAATAADLDVVKAGIDANTAEIQAIPTT